ncbi:MAG: T9SS type A sorting domain-containing protein, partial [Melioribacter sp.]|nr:T9SS type A sorting domain-containing protein [Melioribacter sp.]
QSAAFGRIEYLKTDEKNVASLMSNLPEEYSISNYPNPFNPTTTINYQLPEKSFVTLKVFDILGKEVATLVNETKSAGYHTVIFDAGHSERGRGMTSGVYIYTIQANGITQSKKMLLAK